MDNIAPSTSAPQSDLNSSRSARGSQARPEVRAQPEASQSALPEALSRKNTSAQIRRDEELNRFLVTIKDKDSGEIVREVPPEALLKFARNLEELKGILFDETL